ncbi:putative quinol monooxygenase, partial [Embleya sp. NPDC059213]|uniref:putative quinol monooxygenase n=1 Tax=Embleya sp. NPDC059213 TaxID=3346771 RepID=UPI003674619F
MIFIVVKFPVKPEHADGWPEQAAAFTEATRGEPGNLWFEWSRSLEDPSTYVLVEAFRDDAAAAHVNSDHFKAALERFRPLLRIGEENDLLGRGLDELVVLLFHH